MTKALVLVCFAAAFAAGLAVGARWHRPAPPAATQPSGPGGRLAEELNLTARQREELDKIWSEMARSGGRDREERRRQVYRDRDQAIAALIRPEDKPRYEEIRKKQDEQMAALDGEWRGSLQTAVERTRRILTPEQRVKYEEVLQRRQKERGSHDWRRGERERDSGHRGGRHPASNPASRPGA